MAWGAEGRRQRRQRAETHGGATAKVDEGGCAAASPRLASRLSATSRSPQAVAIKVGACPDTTGDSSPAPTAPSPATQPPATAASHPTRAPNWLVVKLVPPVPHQRDSSRHDDLVEQW